ncbi:GDYXXLXY domain-containing protein [Myroides sp. M-43]|uniref:GDYXXLXY domain-containing protein n=1 Tax=Myroides oncorhynchi TaxID=2893756 RepID=UPI001E405938|nr:GDYXXLXY domain-containing protein [Myroides oncorhynchi]MCC9044019.1 GDYXXLXY domain-containing protein [Myroides oncorhynchi]
MIKSKNSIILSVFVLIGIFFVRAVLQKENTIKEGQLVLLELAPVDPRSLIQGDYMILNYAISNQTRAFDQVIVDTIVPALNDSIAVSEVEENVLRAQQDIQEAVEKAELNKRGYVLLSLDKDNVGSMVMMMNEMGKKKENQIYIKYFNYQGWRFNIGAESFFFQEGEAKKYEQAKYGGLRVDEQGNSVLIGMYDKDRKLIN